MPPRDKKTNAKPVSLMGPYPGPRKMGPPGESPPPIWEIFVGGDLTDNQKELSEQLVELPRESRGVIYFDSCGGSAYVGLCLATLIRLRGLKATAVVSGECSSAAIMPFAACHDRYVTPHSSLLFHPIRWQSEEQVRLEEAAEWTRHFKLMEADHDQLIAKLFGCSEELLGTWTRPGKFVSGPELVEAGLAKMVDLFSGTIWKQMADLGR